MVYGWFLSFLNPAMEVAEFFFEGNAETGLIMKT
jgi:hypothetical protein